HLLVFKSSTFTTLCTHHTRPYLCIFLERQLVVARTLCARHLQKTHGDGVSFPNQLNVTLLWCGEPFLDTHLAKPNFQVHRRSLGHGSPLEHAHGLPRLVPSKNNRNTHVGML
ncbi:unnamed protein product, partial [Ectocarpus fasciculatus]